MKNGSLIAVAGILSLDAVLLFFFERGVFRSGILKSVSDWNLCIDLVIVISIIIYISIPTKKTNKTSCLATYPHSTSLRCRPSSTISSPTPCIISQFWFNARPTFARENRALVLVGNLIVIYQALLKKSSIR